MTSGTDGDCKPSPRDLRAPSSLVGLEIDGRYRVVERVGGGGMGSVYRVEQLRLGTSLALKVLRPELAEDARMVERFLREARAAASVESEHVVPIVDSGTLENGLPYFVMQLLVGSDLRALLGAERALAPARAVNLIIDACRGLHAAHRRGLVHRDLKPANLFVTRGDDGRDVAKVLDFGVAKDAGADSTRPGALIGTVRYMAPEQIGLDVPIGPATDLFALGVILYECIAGEVPFAGDTTERILYRIMTAEPEPLAARVQGLPSGLASVVMRALEKDPARRFASAPELIDALLPFAGARRAHGSLLDASDETESVEPRLHSAAEPSSRVTKSRSSARVRVPALAMAAGFGALAGAVAMLGYSRSSALDDPPPGAALPASQSLPSASVEQSATPRLEPAAAEPAPPPIAEPTVSTAASALAGAPQTPRRVPPAAPSSSSVPALPARKLPKTDFDPVNPYAP